MKSKVRIWLFVGWLVFSFVMAISPASSHTSLLNSKPAAGEVMLASPASVQLVFDGSLTDVANANILKVQDETGQDVSEGRLRILGNIMEKGLIENLPAGTFTVLYRVLSEDGHVVSNSYQFTIRPATAGSAKTDAVNQGSQLQTRSKEPVIASGTKTDGTNQDSQFQTPSRVESLSKSTIHKDKAREQNNVKKDFLQRHSAHIFWSVFLVCVSTAWFVWEVLRNKKELGLSRRP